jgi:hypothetical protein
MECHWSLNAFQLPKPHQLWGPSSDSCQQTDFQADIQIRERKGCRAATRIHIQAWTVPRFFRPRILLFQSFCTFLFDGLACLPRHDNFSIIYRDIWILKTHQIANSEDLRYAHRHPQVPQRVSTHCWCWAASRDAHSVKNEEIGGMARGGIEDHPRS